MTLTKYVDLPVKDHDDLSKLKVQYFILQYRNFLRKDKWPILSSFYFETTFTWFGGILSWIMMHTCHSVQYKIIYEISRLQSYISLIQDSCQELASNLTSDIFFNQNECHVINESFQFIIIWLVLCFLLKFLAHEIWPKFWRNFRQILGKFRRPLPPTF